MPHRGSTLASRLLSTIVDRQILQRDRLAMELRVPVALLDQWLANARSIPFERQLVLANLLIERVPLLARDGYRLRDQLRAMVAYHTHATKTHLTAPVSRFKPLRNDSPNQRPS